MALLQRSIALRRHRRVGYGRVSRGAGIPHLQSRKSGVHSAALCLHRMVVSTVWEAVRGFATCVEEDRIETAGDMSVACSRCTVSLTAVRKSFTVPSGGSKPYRVTRASRTTT